MPSGFVGHSGDPTTALSGVSGRVADDPQDRPTGGRPGGDPAANRYCRRRTGERWQQFPPFVGGLQRSILRVTECGVAAGPGRLAGYNVTACATLDCAEARVERPDGVDEAIAVVDGGGD